MERSGASVLVLWLLFVALCVAAITRSGFSTDLEAFLPEAPTPTQQLLVDQLRDSVVARLVLVGIEGEDEQGLATISRSMVRQLSADPAFETVNNGEQDLLSGDAAFLFEHRYLLSPAVREGHFSAGSLRLALEKQLELLASSMGAVSGQYLANDPTAEFLAIVDRFQLESRPQSRHGVWFNGSGTRALLVAQTSAPGFDIDAQQTALSRIEAAFKEAYTDTAATDASLVMVGPGVFAVQIRDAVKADAIRVTAAASIAIMVLLFVVLRSLRSVALVALPVATGALAGIAAVAFVFGEIHGITLGFGATLIGESVDYAIHLLAGTGRGQRPRQTLSRIWPVLRIGVLTSIAGSAALLFSGFPGLAQLGLFSIAGLVTALSVTRWVLPQLMPRELTGQSADRYGPALAKLVGRAARWRVPSLVLVGGCAAWLLYSGGTAWNDDFESLSPVSESAKALDRELRAELGAPDVRNLVVVHGVDQEGALQIAESVGSRLDVLVGEQALAAYQSPAVYLPSVSMQRARQDAIPGETALRQNLERAAAGLPFKAGIFEAFIEEAQRAKNVQPLTRTDLGSLTLAGQVDNLLVQRRNGWSVMMPLMDVANPVELAAALQGFDPRQVQLVDMKVETNALYHGYRVQILTFSLMGALAIVIVLLAALRSIHRCAAVILPIVAALVVTVSILLAAGVELTMFHLVAMLLVVGVGSNYTLFFDGSLPQGDGRERTYLSLAVCNLSTVLGFGLIALASTPVLKAIGMTVAIGAALSLVFGAVFMRRGLPSAGASAAA